MDSRCKDGRYPKRSERVIVYLYVSDISAVFNVNRLENRTIKFCRIAY